MTVRELKAILDHEVRYGNGELEIYVEPNRNTSAPKPQRRVSTGGLDPYKKGTAYYEL